MLCRTRSTGALSGRRWHASSQRNQSSPKVPPSGVGTTVRWYLACTAKLRSVTAQHRELGDGSKIHLLMHYCVLSERIATVPHMVLNAKPCCSWAGWKGATSTPGVAQRVWQYHGCRSQCQMCQRGWVHTGYKGLQRPGQVRRGPVGSAETISGKLSQRAFAASYAWKPAG